MKASRSLLLVAVSLSGMTACTLLVGTDDLSDGALATTDANSDQTADVTAPIDSGGDTTSFVDAGDAASSSPCSTPHAFCDDFDEGTLDLLSRWDRIQAQAGPLAIDSELSLSPPRSLRTVIVSGSGRRDSMLTKVIPLPNGKTRVDVDVRVVTDGGKDFGELDPIEVRLLPAPSGFKFHALYVFIREDGTRAQYFAERDDAGVHSIERPIPFPLGDWRHVTFMFDRTSPTATISLDGNLVSLDTLASGSNVLELSVGAPFTQDLQEGSWTVHVDNVVVDAP